MKQEFLKRARPQVCAFKNKFDELGPKASLIIVTVMSIRVPEQASADARAIIRIINFMILRYEACQNSLHRFEFSFVDSAEYQNAFCFEIVHRKGFVHDTFRILLWKHLGQILPEVQIRNCR